METQKAISRPLPCFLFISWIDNENLEVIKLIVIFLNDGWFAFYNLNSIKDLYTEIVL